jgi:hypothetical protein
LNATFPSPDLPFIIILCRFKVVYRAFDCRRSPEGHIEGHHHDKSRHGGHRGCIRIFLEL